MPELADPKAHVHPLHAPANEVMRFIPPQGGIRYAELQVTSNFTFLAGASHPDELVLQSAALGYHAIGIADRNSLAGVVRAHVAAKEIGIPIAIGCRLELTQPAGLSILVYPTSRDAYGRLCRLLTLGKRRAEKGECHLTLHDVLEHQQGLLAIVIPPATLDQDFIETLRGLWRVFDDDRLSLAASVLLGADDATRLDQLIALSRHVGVPLVATNDVHYHVPERRALQDVLACIRHGCTIERAGYLLFPNGERYLKPPEAMASLFSRCPAAIARTVEIADRATRFSLDELRYEYPDEVVPPGLTPMQHLVDLTWQGAAKRYPQGVPDRVRKQIEHEFRLIEDLNYAPYFLTVHDLVQFAQGRDILCQGRGAAANSAVCYCLGVTAVDPDRIDLLFERFVSKERNEPPDIDIDFEHERREEVIQYIYGKYGRDRAALTAEVISYRGKSAIRDVGKAMGLSLDCVDKLAKNRDWWSDTVESSERLRELGLNPDDPTMKWVIALASEIQGFPRHLSQHVGGFVITRTPLCELVPIENAAMAERTVIEWDKDDVDAMNMLKVDVLALGMLTCIRKAIALLNLHKPTRYESPAQKQLPQTASMTSASGSRSAARRSIGQFNARQNLVLGALFDPGGSTASERAAESCQPPQASPPHPWPLEFHTIPAEDPAVYDMICKADTIGVFQIESRAQMSMLPRLRPRKFYDLVIEVAIVRPGPIQGNMVHPYLRRRNKEEEPEYHTPAVQRVLEKTLGVPLFQEQAMSLAIVAAGFTPGEADQLRRAIAAWKTRGNKIAYFGERIIKGMTQRGYTREFAERCFEQIKGFSGYGFPESHAASFALLVYVSAWIKRHYPAAFAAALINSQPMGFYLPAQIVRDAQEHGVEVRPVDVNFSQWDCTLEDSQYLRLGLRLIKGLSEADAQLIVSTIKKHGSFRSIDALHRASGVRISVLRRLAGADAFSSMGLDRQSALWHVRALSDERLPMFDERVPAVDSRLPAEISNAQVNYQDQSEHPADSRQRTADTPNLPPVHPLRKVAHDYAAIGLSLRPHPISFIRERLQTMGATSNIELKDEKRWRQGKNIAVAGIVLVRQRPSTANGIVFMTIEDESGIANLIIRPKIYQKYRKAARHAVVVMVRGRVERQGQVVHVVAQQIEEVVLQSESIEQASRDFH